jgi:hypothetical protein
MLRHSKTIAVLVLVGCGARGALDVTSGSGGASGVGGASGTGLTSSTGTSTLGNSAAHLLPACAPADGPMLQLDIDDTSTCPGSGEQRPGLQFFIWGPDLGGLHDGVTLQVSGDVIHGYTTAGRLTAPNLPLVFAKSGSLVFTTFVPHQSATGTYDITLVDGSTTQGSFTANACPGYSLCG